MTALNLKFNFQLIYAQHNTGPGYNSNRHAAQFVLFFTLQNLNRSSPGFGQYVWFGFPIYDSRDAFAKPSLHIDRDTQSLIYGIDTSRYFAASTHSGQKLSVSANILPDVKNALNYAFNNNILSSKNMADYKIGGMNTGFEVPGLSIVTTRIQGLKLEQVTPK
jgi:hypothetical protein